MERARNTRSTSSHGSSSKARSSPTTDGDPDELQSAIDIVLRRFAEHHNLEGAFGRRALTERAKGILMRRHRIEEQEAFELLRSQSRRSGRKLIEVAEAVATSHLLLPPRGTDTADG